MAAPPRYSSVNISAAPRAFVGTAADLLFRVGRSVLGEDRVPTAQANAWAAVCADMQRARERDETQRWIANKYNSHTAVA